MVSETGCETLPAAPSYPCLEPLPAAKPPCWFVPSPSPAPATDALPDAAPRHGPSAAPEPWSHCPATTAATLLLRDSTPLPLLASGSAHVALLPRLMNRPLGSRPSRQGFKNRAQGPPPRRRPDRKNHRDLSSKLTPKGLQST